MLEAEEEHPLRSASGSLSQGGRQGAEEAHKPAGQAAEGCDHDPHPAQPACWSGNLSQHPDFLAADPPCLGEDPASPGVLHGNPPRLAPDPLVPLGPGNTAQMGGGKN